MCNLGSYGKYSSSYGPGATGGSFRWNAYDGDNESLTSIPCFLNNSRVNKLRLAKNSKQKFQKLK